MAKLPARHGTVPGRTRTAGLRGRRGGAARNGAGTAGKVPVVTAIPCSTDFRSAEDARTATTRADRLYRAAAAGSCCGHDEDCAAAAPRDAGVHLAPGVLGGAEEECDVHRDRRFAPRARRLPGQEHPHSQLGSAGEGVGGLRSRLRAGGPLWAVAQQVCAPHGSPLSLRPSARRLSVVHHAIVRAHGREPCCRLAAS